MHFVYTLQLYYKNDSCIHTRCNSYLLLHFHSAPKWKDSFSDVSVTPFNEYVGPSPPLGNTIKIVDMFRLFFTTALMREIVEQTNRYARSILGEGNTFDVVTDADIWAFFGLCIIMGFHQLPALHHYWSTDPHFFCPAISDHMTRARFMFIWRFFHFTDNVSATTTSQGAAN